MTAQVKALVWREANVLNDVLCPGSDDLTPELVEQFKLNQKEQISHRSALALFSLKLDAREEEAAAQIVSNWDNIQQWQKKQLVTKA